MDITIRITDADFEALMALASRLNAAVVGRDGKRFHSIPGVGGVALHLGLQHMAPLFGVTLRGATSEADALTAAIEHELRTLHLKRELRAFAGDAA